MLSAEAARKFTEDGRRGWAQGMGETSNQNRATSSGRRRGDLMKRRELLLLFCSAMLTAPRVRAQQKAMPVIGVLSSNWPPTEPWMAAFRQGLSESGYVEGRDVAFEYRWAEGSYDRLPALAADLVGRKVDLIAAGAAPAALAAKSATSTIPIVFATGTDPVEDGLVASLARPAATLPASAASTSS
jgi:putative tryptophan/tyrosine transport system substrate-binding protein